MNSSFMSEVDDMTDRYFVDISEISTSYSTSTVIHLLQQLERNDLVHDFTLFKIPSLPLASRLTEKHLIYPSISITLYCQRETK